MKILAALIALAAIAFPNAYSARANTSPTQSSQDGWQTITDGSFSFRLPADMKETRNMPDHSGHQRVFGGNQIPLFTFNYGAGSCDITTPQANKPGVEQSVVEVGGRKALLTTSPSPNAGHLLAGICFANVDNNGRRLKFYAVCVDRDALNLATEIFRTVEFRNQ